MSHWRNEIKQLGKREFERREMERLGFWPPADVGEESHSPPAMRAKLAPLNDELRLVAETARPLRARLAEVERELSSAGAIEAKLADVRRARLERKERRAHEREERARQDQAWRSAQLPHLG